jgi:DNA-binding NarL/FixJ family response regulator
MASFAQFRSCRSNRRPVPKAPTVCVVDPQAGDYEAWHSLAESHNVRLVVLESASQALRISATTRVDLWVVNASLPGRSGLELCRMFKAQSPHAAVYVVADEYSPETERAAWQAQATLFGCKGGHADWLAQWLQTRCASNSGAYPRAA